LISRPLPKKGGEKKTRDFFCEVLSSKAMLSAGHSFLFPLDMLAPGSLSNRYNGGMESTMSLCHSPEGRYGCLIHYGSVHSTISENENTGSQPN
jgi:hypothetical protein